MICEVFMKKSVKFGVVSVACGSAIALAIPATSVASVPSRVVDRAIVDCSRGGMLQVDLERERNRFEVDVEVYGSSRESWTVTWSTNGRTVHTVTRSANREGELNVWRYMPTRSKAIVVTARSADGESCRATVRR